MVASAVKEEPSATGARALPHQSGFGGAILLVALVSFTIKAAGPALLGNRPLPPRAASVIALFAPALLAGLVLTDFAGAGWSEADWTIAAGLSAAAIAYLCRVQVLVCVTIAVLTTALLRSLV